MNRIMLRKPLALLLSVVMVLSSALVYAPAYAEGCDHTDHGEIADVCIAIEQFEGEDVVQDLLNMDYLVEEHDHDDSLPLVTVIVPEPEPEPEPTYIKGAHVFIQRQDYMLNGSFKFVKLDNRPFEWVEIFNTSDLFFNGSPYYLVVTGPFPDVLEEEPSTVIQTSDEEEDVIKAEVLELYSLTVKPIIYAVDDEVDTLEDTPVNIDFLLNDVLPIDLFESAIIAELFDVSEGPVGGTVEFEVDESNTSGYRAVYTPDFGFVGEGSFSYTVHLSDDVWYEATVTITVMPDNERYPWLIVNAVIVTDVDDIGEVELLEANIVPDFVEPAVTFDFASAKIISLTPIVTSKGISGFSDMTATYDPIIDENVLLEVVVEDQYGRIATGVIVVVVSDDSSFAKITIDVPGPIYLNQYSASDPEAYDEDSVRDGVTYIPSMYKDIKYLYERVNFLEPEYGFYDTNIIDTDGNPISIIYYYGNFDVEYWMEDTSNVVVSKGFRDVYINAQPKISLAPDINPESVWLPDHYDLSTVGPLDVECMVVYKGYQILDKLYGFDFEDYNLNSEDIERDYDMPMSEDLADYLDMNVKFYLPADEDEGYVWFPIGEFWDHLIVGIPGEEKPANSEESDSDDDGVYTIYDVRFTLTDSTGFESEMTELCLLKVYNNEPVLTLTDEFVAKGMLENFVPFSLISVFDEEDVDLFATDAEMQAMIEMSINGSVSPHDTVLNSEGEYEITFNYTDKHGEPADEKELRVHIIKEPEIVFNPATVDMEINGLFPVYNGLGVYFYNPNYSGTSLAENGDLYHEFDAYLGTDTTADPLEELVHMTVAGPQTITYVATTLVEDDGELYPVTTTKERTINVFVNDGYKDVVYMSDFWKPDGTMFSLSIDSVLNEEKMKRYNTYPIMIKYDPLLTDDYKIVSAVVMTERDPVREGELTSSSDSFDTIYFRHQTALDDLAVLNNGDIYALSDHDVYEYNREFGVFVYRFDVDHELQFALDSIIEHNDWDVEIRVPTYNFQSMTVDELDRLVIASGEVPQLAMDIDEPLFEFEHGLIYFSPVGYLVEQPTFDPSVSETPEHVSEMHYIKGLGLMDIIDLTPQGTDYNGAFDVITDIAYSSDLTEVYGIGGYGDLSVKDIDSETREYIYRLFKVEEFEIDTDPRIPEELFIKAFGNVKLSDTMDGYRYKGIATLGEDIFLTRYMDWNITRVSLVPAMRIEMYQTYVDRYRFDGEDFMEQFDLVLNDESYDSDRIEDMFNGALGAASTYKKELSMLPVSHTLNIHDGVQPTIKTVEFVVTALPEMAYGDVEWSFVDPTDSQYFDNLDNGEFTLKTGVNSAMEVKIQAAVYDKLAADTITLEGSIFITTSRTPTPPNDDPDPDPTPARRTTPTTPVIGVTLDIDAITLDYGETADSNFTSYDFTETVTGTTNKNVTWSLDDDTFVTVDADGVVTANADIPTSTGDITVELTVRTVDGGATATATILFEEQTPLGAIEFFAPYVSGYTDGMFRANGEVTRAEVASMFARILKLNRTSLGTQNFTDVSKGHWAYGSIQAMFTTGLFSGYLDDEGSRYFDPSAAISRGEIAQVFSNYWNFLDISVTSENMTSIPDVAPTYWAAPAINRIFNTNIFNGFDNGAFRPEDPTLRGQIVSMINRLIARPANKAGFGTFPDIPVTSEYFGDIEAASQTFLKPQAE